MILMQINYSLTLPVNSNKIIHGERQRRQAYNSIFRSLSPSLSFENPTSLFSYRMPEQPKWSFNTQTRGGNTLFTGDYRVNDRWSINPNLNLNHQLRPVGGGVGLTYRFKRSTDNENISKQVR